MHIQQFVENLDVGNPRVLGCQKYKLDWLLTKALAELPYERGVLTNTWRVWPEPADFVSEDIQKVA